jgi:gliding motility-associated peptidyl-prolyl isomerase
MNAAEEEALKAYMELDSTSRYTSSAHGFWYSDSDRSPGGNNPEEGDQLLYTYEVYGLDGSLIYTTEDIGQVTYKMDQQELEEGIRLALKLMTEGETRKFLFPSHLMFGYLGDENNIGINQPLIYIIHLIKIDKNDEN